MNWQVRWKVLIALPKFVNMEKTLAIVSHRCRLEVSNKFYVIKMSPLKDFIV